MASRPLKHRHNVPTGPQSVYRKTVLPNGLRIVTEEIPYVRSVSVGTWINVGSRDESERMNGVSHFVEHMVFKGTKHYRVHQIAQSLESVGGYLNAFTTKENTCYYARILDAHLPKAIDVLSDLVQYPLFEAKEMEREKQVVIEEIKNIEDNPEDLIHDYFDKSLFHKHPLANPVTGSAENITNFSVADLANHRARYYVPGEMVLAAAGNLKHEAVVELVERYFKLRKNGGERPRRGRMLGARRAEQKILERPITQAHICLGTIGFGVKHHLRYPLFVMNTLLGEGMSSRLFQNIREKFGFAYTVYSFISFLSDTGNFGIYIGTDGSKIDRSIGLIHKELEKLRSKPVGRAELNRTKEQLKGTMMLGLESTSSRMMRLGSAELYFGEHIPLDEILRRIESVSSEDIIEVANHLLKEERFSTVIFKPRPGKAE